LRWKIRLTYIRVNLNLALFAHARTVTPNAAPAGSPSNAHVADDASKRRHLAGGFLRGGARQNRRQYAGATIDCLSRD
jgi:hypothetical protein